MTKVKYLEEHRNLKLEIARLKRGIEEIEDSLGSIKALTYDKERLQGGLNYTIEDKLVNGIDDIIDMKELMKLKLEKSLLMQKEIRKEIEKLESSLEKQVLELHYIHGETWEKVAELTEISVRHIYRIRDRALINLKKLV